MGTAAVNESPGKFMLILWNSWRKVYEIAKNGCEK
jgi:hypothetical protein